MNTNLLKSSANKLNKITVNIQIDSTKDGSFIAQVLGMPEYKAVGATREEALSNLSKLLTASLEKTEIISLDIELPKAKSENPYLKIAGKYKEDPQFQEMLDHIENYRRELDAQMEEYYQKLDVEETK